MFRNAEAVMAFVEKYGIRQIDLKFTDLFGGLHHISVSTRYVNQDKIAEGIGFDASSIPGFKALESGDMVLRPIVETGFKDPFFELPTLSFYCEIVEADTLHGFSRDPRTIACRALAAMKQSGIADVSLWGPEFEFYLFDRISMCNHEGVAHVEIGSEEAELTGHADAACDHALRIPSQKGYLVSPAQDRYMDVRGAISDQLFEAGVPVKYHHHEVGAPGQSEIELEMDDLVAAADNVQTVKYFVRMLAAQNGLTATFMPKPLYNMAGSGMHFHQHLFKGGQPVFYREGGYADLSPEALSYIAGILRHGPALLALTNPSTNSFKRLVPGFEAPVKSFFSLANRSAAIRIPKYARAPAEKRMEFRPPDATCNPYLAMAAMLMAGLDGIRNHLDPAALGFGPFDENIFDTAREGLQSLPTSLPEALCALEADHDFLTRDGVFTPDAIETWIRTKRERDVIAIERRPHPYEFELYYNC